MKKFLSILLALAVGFTFTFGSAMSAFADSTTGTYTGDEAKSLLQDAVAQAKADVYEVNYSTDHDGVSAKKDYTSWEISAEYMQAGIQAAYSKVLDDINDMANATVLAGAKDAITGVIIGGNTVSFSGNKTQDRGNMTALLESYAISDGLVEAEKAAFADYQTYLTGLVDKVDVSVYTDTNYKANNHVNEKGELVGYTAKDGKTYDTSIEAANADIAYAKAVISNAKFVPELEGNSEDADNLKTWKVKSYADLYDALFNDAADKTHIKVVKTETAEDEIVEGKVIGLTYELTGEYSTKAMESGSAATLSAAQALAKARLAALVAEYQATKNYKSTQDAEIAAYVEAQTYVIENTTTITEANALLATDKSDNRLNAYIDANVAKGNITVPYSQRCVAAASYKSDMEAVKVNCTTRGYAWDAEKAEEVMTAELIKIYNGGAAPTVNILYATTNGIASSDLTAGQKAAAKIDLSKVVADTATVATDADGKDIKADVYTFPMTFVDASSVKKQAKLEKVDDNTAAADVYTYFEKQWDAVKTAVDTYNTAVDAAVTSDDVAAAAYTLYVAIKDIKASTIYTNVAKNENQTALVKYAGLTYDRANANNITKEDIFVTFNEEVAIHENGEGLKAANVNLWYIAQGATDKATAEAMYSDACKVIDAFKTLTTIKSEANAVTTQINALPAKASDVKLTDKDAIVAAFDAFDALSADAQKYVTNTKRLFDDIEAVKELDEYDLKVKAAALPKEAAATTADKEAIKEYKKAYEAYADTTAYNADGVTALANSPYNYKAALGNIQEAERKAIRAQYEALAAKANAGTLTADDAAAIKALQDAIAAYIDEYKESPDKETDSVKVEIETPKIASTIAKDATWTAEDAKAYVQDLSIAARTAKVGKKVKVTIKADVQALVDNGFTVEYKFYKSTKKGSGYKLTLKKATNTYTNTNPVKGKNYYKVKLVVKDANGAVVATTPLTQCKYGVRTIK